MKKKTVKITDIKRWIKRWEKQYRREVIKKWKGTELQNFYEVELNRTLDLFSQMLEELGKDDDK